MGFLRPLLPYIYNVFLACFDDKVHIVYLIPNKLGSNNTTLTCSLHILPRLFIWYTCVVISTNVILMCALQLFSRIISIIPAFFCSIWVIVTLFQGSVFNIVLIYTGFSFAVRDPKWIKTKNCLYCCNQKSVDRPQQNFHISASCRHEWDIIS